MNFNPFDLLDDDNEDNEDNNKVIIDQQRFNNDDIVSNKYKTKTFSNKINNLSINF